MALADTIEIDVKSASNVLLLAPTMDVNTEVGCGTLLGAAGPQVEALLAVLTVESPEDLLDTWRSYVSEESPANAAFMVLGGQPGPVNEAEADAGDPDVHHIKNPSNLTDLGVKTSGCLNDWHGHQLKASCCFQSITTLLQYVESRVVYRFLHQFAQQITAIDAVAHYHMDPSAHEPAVVNTMLTLFDAVVELEGDTWRVRTRS